MEESSFYHFIQLLHGIINSEGDKIMAKKEKNGTLKEAPPRELIFEKAMEQIVEGVAMADMEGYVQYVNTSWAKMHGYRADELMGEHLGIFHSAEQMTKEAIPFLERAKKSGIHQGEIGHVRKDGTPFRVQMTLSLLKDRHDAPTGFVATAQDMSERKRAEGVMARQATELREISTPVVQLWQGVVCLPLIGTLDSQRTQEIMEKLLQRIVETNSGIAIVDITGVPTVDTQTARHLLETIAAVRLLGAQVILTGISPSIAQTIVHLGIDLTSVITRTSLASGLALALEMMDLVISRRASEH
jgi:PAS domain S-box-containing protein